MSKSARDNEEVVQWSSRSETARPFTLIKRIVRDLPIAASMGWQLAMRGLAVSYRNSKLGYLWLVLQPAAYAGIFVIIKFGMRGAGFDVDTGHVAPALFALVGMTLYQAFFEALNEQIDAIRRSRDVLKTLRVPAEAFFLAPLITSLVSLFIRLALIAIFLLIFQPALPTTAWFFPLTAIGVVFVGCALGYVLLPFASLYQDIRRTVQSMTLGALLLSPILYPATTNTDSLLHIINVYNPLAALVATARDVLFDGSFVLLDAAIGWLIAGVIATAVMSLIVRAVLPILVERVAP